MSSRPDSSESVLSIRFLFTFLHMLQILISLATDKTRVEARQSFTITAEKEIDSRCQQGTLLNRVTPLFASGARRAYQDSVW